MYSQSTKKHKMDEKFIGKEKTKQKKIKIGIRVEEIKEKINKLFDDEEADTYVRKKTINALKREYNSL